MNAWIGHVRGALLLHTPEFLRFRNASDGVLRGALLIVIVALLAAFPRFVIDFATGVRSNTVTEAQSAAAAETDAAMQMIAPYMGSVSPAVQAQIRQSVELWVETAIRIESLPSPLPRPVAGALRALGHWLATPFSGGGLPLTAATLGTWLGYGIWVMLAAKLLGGTADLRNFFGATSLFAAPHLLNVFAPVPVLNTIAALIAFFWGLVIYVKATAVSHEMTIERALLAVLLPALVAVLLIILAVILLILFSALGSRA